MLEAQWFQGKFICVELDGDLYRIPRCVKDRYQEFQPFFVTNVVEAFNRKIIQATKDLVCAYKLDVIFYQIWGVQGIEALLQTVRNIHSLAPNVPIILDARLNNSPRAVTNFGHYAFDVLGVDAITVNPYLGMKSLNAILERREKGIMVLCRTSHSGSDEFQGRALAGGEPLYAYVARQVVEKWNIYGNCSIFVEGGFPEEVFQLRKIIEEMPMFLSKVTLSRENNPIISAGRDDRGLGIVVTSLEEAPFASKCNNFDKIARYELEKFRTFMESYE
ncbi:MAG: orotidine-5'-phosphate decarboxylase [Candidatus Moraniibacteriota bacterium]|nr:MAG: orotidine-5'-phosphate decarboxylase [Candidatus Moranbacteria bacterium]